MVDRGRFKQEVEKPVLRVADPGRRRFLRDGFRLRIDGVSTSQRQSTDGRQSRRPSALQLAKQLWFVRHAD